MQNEMRDRLIEVLRHKGCVYLADFLLENGVIVPPCKVGDMVYYNLGKNASLPLGTKRTLCLKVGAIANMENKEDWFVRTEFSGAIADFKFSDFGKTVFLTKEEAEKALKERNSDN